MSMLNDFDNNVLHIRDQYIETFKENICKITNGDASREEKINTLEQIFDKYNYYDEVDIVASELVILINMHYTIFKEKIKKYEGLINNLYVYKSTRNECYDHIVYKIICLLFDGVKQLGNDKVQVIFNGICHTMSTYVEGQCLSILCALICYACENDGFYEGSAIDDDFYEKSAIDDICDKYTIFHTKTSIPSEGYELAIRRSMDSICKLSCISSNRKLNILKKLNLLYFDSLDKYGSKGLYRHITNAAFDIFTNENIESNKCLSFIDELYQENYGKSIFSDASIEYYGKALYPTDKSYGIFKFVIMILNDRNLSESEIADEMQNARDKFSNGNVRDILNEYVEQFSGNQTTTTNYAKAFEEAGDILANETLMKILDASAQLENV